MKTMQKHKVFRMLALVLVLGTLLAVSAPALAAYNETVYATTALNVRSGPGTNYPIVGALKKGQAVTRTGESGSWSIVMLGGRNVYAHSSYLRASGSGGSSTDGQGACYTTARVNVRTGPGTGYKVLTTLSKGDKVLALGTVGTWTIIQWESGTAYVSSKYLTAAGNGGGTAPGETNPSVGTVEATTDVNVRSGPGTKYSKLGKLSKGERVKMLGTTGDWTRIEYKGKTGYAFSSYVRVVKENPGQDKKLYLTEDAFLYAGPGTGYKKLRSLYAGDVVILLERHGDWARVEYGSSTGYVLYRMLTTKPVTTAKGTAYAPERTAVYAQASTGSKRIGYIAGGEGCRVTGEVRNWVQVNFNGQVGYAAKTNVVVLTSHAQTSFSTSSKEMYAKADSLPVYTIPSEQKNYRYGWMRKNERIQRLAYNDTWTMIRVNGRIAYTLTKNLSDTPVDNPTDPATGDLLRITAIGARMYLDSTMGQPYSHKGTGGSTIVEIPQNTTVTLRRIEGGSYHVYWHTIGKEIFINRNDAELIPKYN